MIIERLKQLVRRIEAHLTPRTHVVSHRDRAIVFVRSRFWDDSDQASFDREIKPYFDALPTTFSPHVIIDAGAATGQFSTAVAVAFPAATVIAFEPSQRQRILLERNGRRNGVAARIRVHATGLWNRTTTLS